MHVIKQMIMTSARLFYRTDTTAVALTPRCASLLCYTTTAASTDTTLNHFRDCACVLVVLKHQLTEHQ